MGPRFPQYFYRNRKRSDARPRRTDTHNVFSALGSSLIRPWPGNGPRIFRSSFVHPSFILRFLTKDQRRINGGSTKHPWTLLGSRVGKVRLWAVSCELWAVSCELWAVSYELQAVCFKLSSTRALRAVWLRIPDGPGLCLSPFTGMENDLTARHLFRRWVSQMYFQKPVNSSSARGLADDLKPLPLRKARQTPGRLKELFIFRRKDFHKTIRLFSQWDQDVISQFYYR